VIFVECSGGLGNQLFIWNAAHHLAKHFNDRITLVFPRDRDTRSDRPFELKVLTSLCSHDIEIRESRFLSKLSQLIDFLSNKFKLSEGTLHQHLGILQWQSTWEKAPVNFGKPRLVRGFFQNYELMAKSEGTTEIRAYLNNLIYEIPFEIQTIQAIHVRHGDYLANRNVIGVLSENFYVDHSQIDLPTIIFTDDLMLDFDMHKFHPSVKVLTPKNLSAWQTLACLTHSKWFVGANSTLSWWAALLRNKGTTKFPWPMYRMDSLNSESLRIPEIDYVRSEFEE
jgi:hypothetical protein